MSEKKDIKIELKKFKAKLSKSMPIERMILFGSYAKNEAKKDSDIDIIIVSPKFGRMKFRKRPVKMYKYWDMNIPFDILCYTPDEFNKMANSVTIVREAVRNGIDLT
jgi:predicted nucleotidyltransferase